MGKIDETLRASTKALSHEADKHTHDWHFATEVTKRDKWGDYAYTLSKFACLCGAVKRVKQFEVEE